MNKNFFIVLTSIVLLIVFSYFGLFDFAQADTGGEIELQNPIQATTIEELINNILNFLWRIALAATPVMIVVGGIIMATSAGNPEQVKTGKNTVIWALAGFALILLSRGLFNLIKEIIGVRGT